MVRVKVIRLDCIATTSWAERNTKSAQCRIRFGVAARLLVTGVMVLGVIVGDILGDIMGDIMGESPLLGDVTGAV